MKVTGIIVLILVVIALLVYFLVLRYPKLKSNPTEGKWYRVTSNEMKDSEGNSYHSFFRKGSENKVLIYFAGGGVSINEETARAVNKTFERREVCMKKMIKIILIAALVIILLIIAAVVIAVVRSQRSYAEDQLKMPKADEEMLGERFEVPRAGLDPVKVNLYIPDEMEKIPVVFNVHGGAFVAGHADMLDTQSDRISKDWNVAVVTIDYKLAKDGITIEYGVKEVVDTVKYFQEHADEYNLDTEKFVLMGYSAGGYHAMMAALELKKDNIDVAAQVLCYLFIKDAVDVYKTLSEEQQATLAPALFIPADNDPISDGSLAYEEVLRQNGVKTEVKKYTGSIHGFLEENNPEYEKMNNKQSKSPEQEIMARDAENFIRDWLNSYFENIGE